MIAGELSSSRAFAKQFASAIAVATQLVIVYSPLDQAIFAAHY